MINKILIQDVPMSARPICIIDGCCNPRQYVGRHDKNGYPAFRQRCAPHHIQFCADNKGLTPTHWSNSFHPYRKWRKTYCENIDGRLGFKCTTNVIWDGMLDTDHMDGNPANNKKENMQTLCKCCHTYKGIVLNKDYLTPGRKTLGLLY